jgi:hypothetical protein
MRPLLRFGGLALFVLALPYACSATGQPPSGASGTTGGTGTTTGSGGGKECDVCLGDSYTPCDNNGQPGDAIMCPSGACAPGKGCVDCVPGSLLCIGNEVHECGPDGSNTDKVVETCDTNAGKVCSNGKCGTACELAADQPSNVGCEFWAVDLDQQDGFNDPASAPWGVVLSNAGEGQANVTIELNEAAPGPARPADGRHPGLDRPRLSPAAGAPDARARLWGEAQRLRLSRHLPLVRAFRIKSSSPIVVYQFNVFTNAFSNDASLLLPTNALGSIYRVIGWGAGHPVAIPGFNILDRSYVTIVGVTPNTQVKVRPSWRIKGNPPIAATMAGGEIMATIGPFDVLNLETADGTFQDDPKTMADLTGTVVQASAPVAVFSGVESTAPPAACSRSPPTEAGRAATPAASITSKIRCSPSSRWACATSSPGAPSARPAATASPTCSASSAWPSRPP